MPYSTLSPLIATSGEAPTATQTAVASPTATPTKDTPQQATKDYKLKIFKSRHLAWFWLDQNFYETA